MSRLEEVEAEIADLDDSYSARTYTDGYADLARTLAAEVDELRGKLAIMEEDVCAAAGELLVPFPQPGSIDAKLLIANRLLKAEIAELRGKLDDVRMGIGCARGQRTTQFCAEAAQRDAVITKLLAMLKPGEEPVPPADPSTLADWNLWSAHHSPWLTKANCYRFACEIAGRTE